MTAPVQTSAGVPPGPWAYQERSDAYTHIVRDAGGGFVCQFGQDTSGKSESHARLLADAGTTHHLTGKTPSELAAEVERLAKDRDALLGASKRVTDAFVALSENPSITTRFRKHRECEAAMLALDAAIHQCEGAKA